MRTALLTAALLIVIGGIATVIAEPKVYRAVRSTTGLAGPEEMDANWAFAVSHHLRLDRTVRASDVLVVGDSHVQGMNTAILGSNTVNFGIGGDTSLGVLTRLRRHESVRRAAAVVLAFGLNDLLYRGLQSFNDNVKEVLDQIPTPIVLSAILPVDERVRELRPQFRNETISDFNAALESHCRQTECKFVPVPIALVDAQGNLKFHEGDGVHLSPAGYRVWTGALRVALAEAVNGLQAKENETDVSEDIRSFWRGCAASIDPAPADGFYRVRSIGGTPETTAAINRLILAGDKTGTFTSPWMYEGDRDITPEVGGFSVLTDADGAPVAVLKTTALKTLPFNQITEEETAVDGPPVRPLEVWRPVHVTFFTGELEKRGKDFAEDMPVTVERFEVICRG